MSVFLYCGGHHDSDRTAVLVWSPRLKLLYCKYHQFMYTLPNKDFLPSFLTSVETSGQSDSSLLEKSALLSFLIVKLLKSVEECWWYYNQLVVEEFPHVYVMNHGDSQKPPKQYISVKYQLAILSFVRAFIISHASTPCISLEVPRNALLVFLITVP